MGTWTFRVCSLEGDQHPLLLVFSVVFGIPAFGLMHGKHIAASRAVHMLDTIRIVAGVQTWQAVLFRKRRWDQALALLDAMSNSTVLR